MFTTVSVQLPHPVLLQLIAHLEKHGGPQDLSAVMLAAVEASTRQCAVRAAHAPASGSRAGMESA